MHRFRSSVALAIVALSLPALAATDSVKGSLTANGKKFALTHAYAQMRKSHSDKSKTELHVVVTDKELSPAAASDDIELMHRHRTNRS